MDREDASIIYPPPQQIDGIQDGQILNSSIIIMIVNSIMQYKTNDGELGNAQ